MSFIFYTPRSTHYRLRIAYRVLSLRFEVRGSRLRIACPTLYSLLFTPFAIRDPQSAIRNRSGFTLLETLVASSILSIVLAILYGVFSQTLTSKRVAEERATLSRMARIVLLRMGEDLQGSFPFAPEDARFVGATHRTSSFPQASMSFMSFANAQVTSVGREGDWNEITYDLIPDPTESTLWQLVRRVQVSTQSSEGIRLSRQNNEVLPLLSHVQGLRIRFFDGRVWLEQWGRDRTKGRVPQAVEVELRLALVGKQGVRNITLTDGVIFTTMVDLPLARPVGPEGQQGGAL